MALNFKETQRGKEYSLGVSLLRREGQYVSVLNNIYELSQNILCSRPDSLYFT